MPKASKDDWQICSSSKHFQVPSLFSVRSRVVVVTGGGSGIGSMIAAAFVANGALVFIASRKDCSGLAEELTSRGPGKCVSLKLDVSSESSIKLMVKELEKHQRVRTEGGR